MISVRNTGRVKLHKARENANGTFSIGKSWPMEDLSTVENYVNLVPKDDEEAQRKLWAGDKGFTVTITKPYYWEAGTAKEKEFFIGSMVKIYNKYTKGEFPILTGFSANELNALTNGQPHLATAEAVRGFGRDGPTAGQTRLGTPDQRPMPPMSPGPPPRRPGESPQLGPDEGRRGPIAGANPNFRRPPGEYQGPRRPGHPEDQLRNGSRPGTGDESRRPSPYAPMQGSPSIPDLRQKRSMEQSVRSRPSGDSMRMRPTMQSQHPMPPTPQFPSQTLTPQSSTSDFVGRPRTPESSNLPAGLSPPRRPFGDDAQSQRSMRSVDDLSQDGSAPSIPLPERRRQNGFPTLNRDGSPHGSRPDTAQSNASSAFTRNDEIPPELPPQRRRPFMEAQPSDVSQRSLGSQGTEAREEVPTPLESPALPMSIPPRRRPHEVPERLRPSVPPTTEVPQETIPRTQPTPPPTSPLPQVPIAPIPSGLPPIEKTLDTNPVASESGNRPVINSPIEEKSADASHRPGMGPMVKKTMAASDAASKFRKAAAAAGAFKPRAGGAAAKLFAKEIKTSTEPDGISGVFVPQRPTAKEIPKPPIQEEEVEKTPEALPTSPPDRLSRERPRISTEVLPSVTISSPLSPIPATPVPESRIDGPLLSPENTIMQKVAPEPEVRRRKRRSQQQITNISKLGIDPGVIDERGVEFESLLSELGWGSSELSAKHIESLESDIKREIARVEAGSWLNHLEQKDDRVEAVERMLDRAIAECDELEGLLTLYNVELGVSRVTRSLCIHHLGQ